MREKILELNFSYPDVKKTVRSLPLTWWVTNRVSSDIGMKLSLVGAFPCLLYAFPLFLCIGVFLHTKLVPSGLKSECGGIFHQSFLWLLRHANEPQKGRNSCLWLQSRSVLRSFGVVSMSCKVNFHVVLSALQYSVCRISYHNVYLSFLLIRYFIDPTFFGIFVCGLFHSFVVNVFPSCILIMWLVSV